jgi:hypothetical protein
MASLTWLISALDPFTWAHREYLCRHRGHVWTERCDPVACSRCGITRARRHWT